MPPSPRPHVVVLGGPNGAGKSTVAARFLRDTLGISAFVNADDLARGLSGFAPEAAAFRAGRLMLARLAELTAARATFAFESTLAGLGVRDVLARCRDVLARCRDVGYGVHVVYLWLPSPEFALARVRRRVADGGHGIPEGDVRRRWARSLANFFDVYRPVADTWYLMDGAAARSAAPVASGAAGEPPHVDDPATWGTVVAQVTALRRGEHP